MMTDYEIIAVVQAHKEGKRIEFRQKLPVTEWCATPLPFWDFAGYEYRIKPDPREWWLADDLDATYAYRNKRPYCKIKVREVLE